MKTILRTDISDIITEPELNIEGKGRDIEKALKWACSRARTVCLSPVRRASASLKYAMDNGYEAGVQ